MSSENSVETILVTGGLGYIGSNVAVDLANRGYNIVIIDNRYPDSNHSPKDQLIYSLITHPTSTVRIYHGDMRKDMSRIFQLNKIDGVIHLAGYKSVSQSLDDPFLYYENNLQSTLNLLRLMREYGVSKLIFSSSCTVYRIHDGPIREDDPQEPSHPYGWTKSMIERIIGDMTAAGQLQACSLRYFNPLGSDASHQLRDDPADRPTNLFPVINEVLREERDCLEVFGGDWETRDGTQVRDYIHIRDLSRAHILAYQQLGWSVPDYETFNLGTGQGHTVMEVLNRCGEVLNVQIPYKIVGRRRGDVQSAVADTSRAREVLGWSAELSLDDMIRDCVSASSSS